jgi:hypothetical protein
MIEMKEKYWKKGSSSSDDVTYCSTAVEVTVFMYYVNAE